MATPRCGLGSASPSGIVTSGAYTPEVVFSLYTLKRALGSDTGSCHDHVTISWMPSPSKAAGSAPEYVPSGVGVNGPVTHVSVWLLSANAPPDEPTHTRSGSPSLSRSVAMSCSGRHQLRTPGVIMLTICTLAPKW